MKEFLFNNHWFILVLSLFLILACSKVTDIISKHLFKYDRESEENISDSELVKMESKSFFVFALLLFGLTVAFDNFILIQKISPQDEVKISSSNELSLNQGKFKIKCGDFSYDECVDVVKNNLEKIITGTETQIEASKIKGSL